jgi:lipopolysaccharide export system protein LptC
MSQSSLRATPPASPAAGQSRLRGGPSPRDRAPPPAGIARRRVLVTLAKIVLPLAALALLAAIALWPEIERFTGRARLQIGRLSGEVEGGKLVDARYNGVDEKGRPYTVTAATAWQIDSERVGLTVPRGDITLENGSWLTLSAKKGTFVQKANQLDLAQEVVLYRDDGTTMRTESVSLDLKAGTAAGSEAVHAEGPFGVLDAQGFTIMDKGTSIDFSGPAHLILNGAGR